MTYCLFMMMIHYYFFVEVVKNGTPTSWCMDGGVWWLDTFLDETQCYNENFNSYWQIFLSLQQESLPK